MLLTETGNITETGNKSQTDPKPRRMYKNYCKNKKHQTAIPAEEKMMRRSKQKEKEEKATKDSSSRS